MTRGVAAVRRTPRDLNVGIKHSRALHKKLRKAKKSSRLVVYENAEHSLLRHKYRIDLLDQLGAFLDAHTTPGVSAAD